MSVEFRDIITISISYTLFWLVIIILILYPLLQMRKTLKRIRNLEKNAE
ncbi:MAG: heme exporter protein CcmD [Promethearchaeota archaeon]